MLAEGFLIFPGRDRILYDTKRLAAAMRQMEHAVLPPVADRVLVRCRHVDLRGVALLVLLEPVDGLVQIDVRHPVQQRRAVVDLVVSPAGPADDAEIARRVDELLGPHGEELIPRVEEAGLHRLAVGENVAQDRPVETSHAGLTEHLDHDALDHFGIVGNLRLGRAAVIGHRPALGDEAVDELHGQAGRDVASVARHEVVADAAHQSARRNAAGEVVLVDQNRVDARPGGGNSGREAAHAGPEHENIAVQQNGNFLLWHGQCLGHQRRPSCVAVNRACS